MQEKASLCRTCQTTGKKGLPDGNGLRVQVRKKRGRSADSHNVTHSKFKASDAEDNPETSTQTHLHDRRVTELCSPVSPRWTRMHGKVLARVQHGHLSHALFIRKLNQRLERQGRVHRGITLGVTQHIKVTVTADIITAPV